jgi:hypothetical protein
MHRICGDSQSGSCDLRGPSTRDRRRAQHSASRPSTVCVSRNYCGRSSVQSLTPPVRPFSPPSIGQLENAALGVPGDAVRPFRPDTRGRPNGRSLAAKHEPIIRSGNPSRGQSSSAVARDTQEPGGRGRYGESRRAITDPEGSVSRRSSVLPVSAKIAWASRNRRSDRQDHPQNGASAEHRERETRASKEKETASRKQAVAFLRPSAGPPSGLWLSRRGLKKKTAPLSPREPDREMRRDVAV